MGHAKGNFCEDTKPSRYLVVHILLEYHLGIGLAFVDQKMRSQSIFIQNLQVHITFIAIFIGEVSIGPDPSNCIWT